jgi:hypothetical protein
VCVQVIDEKDTEEVHQQSTYEPDMLVSYLPGQRLGKAARTDADSQEDK